MKKSMYQTIAAIRKHLLPVITIAAVAFFFAACGGVKSVSYKMTQSTSTRVDLAHSIRVIPSFANLTVQPARVTATAQARELESLTEEQAKQTVVAKALSTVNGDVMLAPRFSIEKSADGNMTSITVTGYAATISSLRPIKDTDVAFNDSLIKKPQRPQQKIALNTMTVAEMEYAPKTSITLTPSELTSKNQRSALEAAKEKMLRQEKADVLFGEQYTFSMTNDVLTSFTLTAFPGKYVNYRQTTLREQFALQPETAPSVRYQTIAADIKPVAQRVQLKFGTGNAGGSESELKEMARSAALQKYDADLLLNETFYFDYQQSVVVVNNSPRIENIITHVTICGTPAVYTNFHALTEDEVVDVQFAPIVYSAEDTSAADTPEQKPAGAIGSFLNLFKKK